MIPRVWCLLWSSYTSIARTRNTRACLSVLRNVQPVVLRVLSDALPVTAAWPDVTAAGISVALRAGPGCGCVGPRVQTSAGRRPAGSYSQLLLLTTPPSASTRLRCRSSYALCTCCLLLHGGCSLVIAPASSFATNRAIQCVYAHDCFPSGEICRVHPFKNNK